jgi:hypothetical protein
MRLSIYDQFVVGVVRPEGGWSKGRPLAYLEEHDKCVPLFHLLIPNDLNDAAVAQYVGDKFRAFSQPGRRVMAVNTARDERRNSPEDVVRLLGTLGAQQ